MELLTFDPTTMVVRSTGDTPGVVAYLSAVDGEGAVLPSGPGKLAIDPGGTHPYILVDADEAIGEVNDPITHAALAVLVGACFAHVVVDLTAVQNYAAVAAVAHRHHEFALLNSQLMHRRFSPAQCEASIKQLEVLIAEHRAAAPDVCRCMRCAVIEFNRPTIEGQVTIAGPLAADVARAAEDLAALDQIVDEATQANPNARLLNDAHLLRRLFGGRRR